MIVPQRDQIRDNYLRDVRIRVPGAVTVDGTQEFADACVFADQALPIYGDAVVIGNFVAGVNKMGSAIDAELVRSGTVRLPATGGTGYVQIVASSGGTVILQGDEIKSGSGLRFQCLATALYQSLAPVPVGGIDTGPATNLAANTPMTWTFSRPGCAPSATVTLAPDGLSGLTGGRTQETDSQALNRLASVRANPPAGGNDAQFQAATLLTPGLSIQQVFTYPAILGPGSIGVAFTLRPGTPGANRISSALQNAQVLAWLIGQFPTDDSILLCTLVPSPVTMTFQVTWAPTAVTWADANPWPVYIPGDVLRIDNVGALSTTAFRLTTGTTTATPQVGQVLSFYDQPAGIFRRKKILTVTPIVAGKSWDLEVDTTNGNSDTTYTPVNGQAAGPWSDSLAGLVTPIVSYFDTLGPGEQLSPLPDPG